MNKNHIRVEHVLAVERQFLERGVVRSGEGQGVFMKCVTYYEQNEWIDYEQYEDAKERLLDEIKGNVEQDVSLRKVVYGHAADGERGSFEEGIAVFSICMKNWEDSELYVEKKSKHAQIIYKSFAKVSRKDCERILAGDVEWMKHSSKNLLKEFYNEITINGIAPSHIMEVEKDVFGEIKGSRHPVSIVFKKSIRYGVGPDKNLFSRTLPMADCTSCDRVLLSCKREIKIPSAVSQIIHMQNMKSMVAYSL